MLIERERERQILSLDSIVDDQFLFLFLFSNQVQRE
jgi:hypothetical protein